MRNSTISKVPTFLVVTINGTIARITNGATIFETLHPVIKRFFPRG